MTDSANIDRREVLKAAGTATAVGLMGSASARTVTDTHYVEAGFSHTFEDGIPANAYETLITHQKWHYVEGDEDAVVVNNALMPDSTFSEFIESDRVLWSDGYNYSAVTLARHKPVPVVVNSLDDSLRSTGAVETVNSYRPPKVDVGFDGSDVTVSYKNEEISVGTGETIHEDLQKRTVVVDTSGSQAPEPAKVTPEIHVRNYGRLPLKEAFPDDGNS